MNKTAIVGVGNLWRGDDAIGLLAVQGMAGLLGESAAIIESDGELTSLLDCFKNFDRVYMIDAIQTGKQKIGSIVELDPIQNPLKESILRSSTHVLGLAQAVEMARSLGSLPKFLRIYGIEARQFEHGSKPSSAVEQAGKMVAKKIIKEIKAYA